MNVFKYSKINIIQLFAILFCVLLLVRLLWIQVLEQERYTIYLEKRTDITLAEQPRGTIFFQDKEGILFDAAITQQGYRLIVNGKKITYKEVVDIYDTIITLDKKTLREGINASRGYIIAADTIPAYLYDTINDKRVEGINLERHYWRKYPWENNAAHVWGYANVENKEIIRGRYGLEKYYDRTLLPHIEFENDTSTLDKIDYAFKHSPSDVITFIDPYIQLHVEKIIQGIQEEWGSEQTSMAILDIHTGGIVGMGTVPSFDPNNFQEYDLETFRNPFIENIYEFGSIMKPLTVSFALDSKKLSLLDTYKDEGSVVVEDYTIYNYDKKGRGDEVTVEEIIKHSLNTGIAYIIEKIGIDTFKNHLQKLDIGSETGIDLPNEIGGQVANVIQSPRLIESVTAGYGQGIAVTPIAMLRAFSILANNGIPISPKIVEYTVTNGKKKQKGFGVEGDKVISTETSDIITDILVSSFDNTLLGGILSEENYSIASKTGTALLPKEDGTYYDDKFLHSFAGYFPAYNPQFVILIFTVDPKVDTTTYASHTLATPFKEMTSAIINYYDIKPDR